MTCLDDGVDAAVDVGHASVAGAPTAGDDLRPGFGLARLERLVREVVAECGLDLTGRHVVTEAATGAYVVTPVLAALAGAARVIAVTRPTRYGTPADVRATTTALAQRLGVAERIDVVEELSDDHLRTADVVTNSGHVRPIDARMADRMKPGAVVPLMYEAWELAARPGDVDVDALRARGVPFAGTNERHPHVDVFSYLGMMAVWQLAEAGISVYRARVAVLCDNDFAPYIERGLIGAGASVQVCTALDDVDEASSLDAVLVALTPCEQPVLDAADAVRIARTWPGAPVVQYWGDIDRAALAAAGVGTWPRQEPGRGHMGVLPSAIGPDAIVRLQCGGLKVAEVLLRAPSACTAADRAYLDLHPAGEVSDAS